MDPLVVTLAVPFREVMNANAERTEHWAVRSRKAAALRERGRLAMRLVGHPHLAEPALCRVTVFYPDRRRRRDVDNLAPTWKHLVDGMVAAGLLDDDDDAHLRGPWAQPAEPGDTRPGALWDLPPVARPFLFQFTFSAREG